MTRTKLGAAESVTVPVFVQLRLRYCTQDAQTRNAHCTLNSTLLSRGCTETLYRVELREHTSHTSTNDVPQCSAGKLARAAVMLAASVLRG